MFWLLAVLIGTSTGFLVARVCRWITGHALIRSLAASFLALTLSSSAMFGAVIALSWHRGRFAAYGFGFSPGGFVYGIVYLLIIAGLHKLAGRSALLAPHRAVLFGVLGGLLGALPFAWLMGLLETA